MARKKRKTGKTEAVEPEKPVETEVLPESPEPLEEAPVNIENLEIKPDLPTPTNAETEDDDGVVEISNKAKLLMLVDNAPAVPDKNGRMFLRELSGEFKPQYERLLLNLRELAECLV